MTEQTVSLSTILHRAITRLVPDAATKILQEYQDFSRHITSDDAKIFAASHAARKAALQHLAVLAKLVTWADKNDPAKSEPATNTEEKMTSLLRDVRHTLANRPDKENDDARDEF